MHKMFQNILFSQKYCSFLKTFEPTIVTVKMKDLNANDMDAAVKIIAGSARSMGLDVEGV